MAFNPEKHHRRSIRLKGYDYSMAGAYFVTMCVSNRQRLFGNVIDGKMILNEAGRMVETIWMQLAIRFEFIELDEFTVMPNHFHGILVLSGRGESCIRPVSDESCIRTDSDESCIRTGRGESCIRPSTVSGDHKDRPDGTLPGTVGRVIQAFKSISTHEYINGVKHKNWTPFPGKLWQRNYYEHIIRDDESLKRIRAYIINNPLQWAYDRENSAGALLATPNDDAVPNVDELWHV
jgi:REP element-mobilizing transposase RayT